MVARCWTLACAAAVVFGLTAAVLFAPPLSLGANGAALFTALFPRGGVAAVVTTPLSSSAAAVATLSSSLAAAAPTLSSASVASAATLSSSAFTTLSSSSFSQAAAMTLSSSFATAAATLSFFAAMAATAGGGRSSVSAGLVPLLGVSLWAETVSAVSVGFSSPSFVAEEKDYKVVLEVARDGATGSFSVDVVFEGGTATPSGGGGKAYPRCAYASCDYNATGTTLVFGSGSGSESVVVAIAADDRYDEGNETFVARLENVVPVSGVVPVLNGSLGNAAVVTIVDTPSPYANSSWPRFRRDNYGRASLATEVLRYPSWSHYVGPLIASSPAIGTGGTIYFGSHDNRLHAVDSHGREIWTFSVGGDVVSSPAIGSEGELYFGCVDGNVYAVDPNGSQLWSFTSGNIVYAHPIVANGSIVLIGSSDTKLYALSTSGTPLWQYTTGGAGIESASAASRGGFVIFGAFDNKVHAVDALAGTAAWAYTSGNFIESSPAIALDGTTYIGSYDNNLYAFGSGGGVKWTYTCGDKVHSSPSIGPDGTIYFGSFDNNVYAVDQSGSLLWSFATGGEVRSSPALSDSVLFIGSNDNFIYAIHTHGSSAGSLAWKYGTGGFVGAAPALFPDGSIAAGSHDGRLYHIVPYSLFHLSARSVAVHEHQYSLELIVLRDGMDTAPEVSVDVVFTDGSATGGTGEGYAKCRYRDCDYNATTVSVHFPPGVTNVSVPVAITMDDDYSEGNETFTASLQNLVLVSGSEAWIADAPYNETMVTIVNTPSPYANSSWPRMCRDGFGRASLDKLALRTPSWSISVDGSCESMSAIGPNGTVYFATTGSVYAASLATGAIRWKVSTGSNFRSSPALGDGCLHIGNQDGILRTLHTSDGTQLWTYDSSSSILSSPILTSDNYVVFGTYDSKVRAVRATDGTLMWTRSVASQVYSSISASSQGVLFCGTYNGNVQALSAATGVILWTRYIFNCESDPSLSPDGLTLYVGTNTHGLYAIEASTGNILWSRSTGSNVYSSAVVDQSGNLYFGTYNGLLWSLGAENNVRWTDSTGGNIGRMPAIGYRSEVYYTSTSGFVRAASLAEPKTVRWTLGIGSNPGTSPSISMDGSIFLGNRAGASSTFYRIVPYSLVHFDVSSINIASETASTASLSIFRDGMDTLPEVTVDLVFLDNSALDGVHYDGTPQTLAFASGVTSLDVSIPIFPAINPGVVNTTFTAALQNLVLLSGEEAWIADFPYNVTEVTIVNNVASVRFASTALTVHEHAYRLSLVVHRDGFDTSGEFTVDVTFAGGTATGGHGASYYKCMYSRCDYNATNVTVSFAAGETNATVIVGIAADDRYDEGNETFVARLENLVVASGTAPVLDHVWNTTEVTIVNSPSPYANSSWPKFRRDSLGHSRMGSHMYRAPSWKTFIGISEVTASLDASGSIFIGGGSNITALSHRGEVVWTFDTGASVQSSAAITSDGRIVIGSYNNNVYCFYPNGTLQWTFPTGGAIDASPAIGEGDSVFVGSRDSTLYALDSGGVSLWNFTTGGYVDSSPSISARGAVLFGSRDFSVYSVSTNGTLQWTFPTGYWIWGSPTVGHDGTIYVPSYDSSIYALQPDDGSLKWSFAAATRIRTSPVVRPDGTILFASNLDDTLILIDHEGGQLAEFVSGGDIFSSPAAVGDRIIFASYDFFVYGLALDMSPVWSFATGGDVQSSPSIDVDGSVYISSYDNNLYHIVPYSLAHFNISAPVTVSENSTSALVTVHRDGMDTAPSFSVDLVFTDGTATSPADYDSTPITVTFSPGEINKTVAIPIVYDNLYGEPVELFTVALTNLVLLSGDEAWIADAPYNTTTVTIINVDPLSSPPTVPTPPSVSTAAFPVTGTVAITWPVPSVPIRGNLPVTLYELFRDGVSLGITTALSFSDTPPLQNTLYTYTLRFNTSLGQSPLSAPTAITTPFRVPILAVVTPAIVPPTGANTVMITGSFLGATASECTGVFVGGTNVTTYAWSASAITVTSAPTSTVSGGTTTLQVHTIHGASNTLTVTTGFPPNITGVSPMSLTNLTGGDSVTLTGLSLGTDAADLVAVLLAGVPCAATTWLSSSVVLCVAGPALGGASGAVSVTTASGGLASVLSFVYVAPSVAPSALPSAVPNVTATPTPLPSTAPPTPTPTPAPPPPPSSSPTIGSITPDLLPLSGGMITITGSSFGTVVDIAFRFAASAADGTVALLQAETLARNVSTTSNTSLSVVAPSTTSNGYMSVTVTHPNTTRSATSPDAIHYSDGCLREGFFGDINTCNPCPSGGTCPGGNRIWPNSGFWNEGEDSGYVAACTPKERCLGGRRSACAEGHEGSMCSQCEHDYMPLNGLCVPCPPDTALWTYIAGDIVVWGIVALSAWSAKTSEHFQRVVAFVSVLQTAGQFSTLITPAMPRWVLYVYDTLDIFLADYAVVKEDCLGRRPAFAHTYIANLLYNFLIGCFMCFGCLAVGYIRRRLAKDPTKSEDLRVFYKDRFTRCMTVWAQLVYTNMTRKSLEALYCYPRGGALHLAIHPAEACFTMTHSILFVLSLAVLGAMTFAWPIWYTLYVRKQPPQKFEDDVRFEHRWGTHIVLLKPDRRYFYLWAYAAAFLVACAEVFAFSEPKARVAVACCAILAHIVATFRLSPHLVPRDDWVLVMYNLPTAMLISISAAAELGSVSNDTLTWFSMLTLAILTGCIVFHGFDLVYHLVKKPENAGQDELTNVELDSDDEIAMWASRGGDEDEKADTPEDPTKEHGSDSEETPPQGGLFASMWGLFPLLSGRGGEDVAAAPANTDDDSAPPATARSGFSMWSMFSGKEADDTPPAPEDSISL